jgi:hypothetical protein
VESAHISVPVINLRRQIMQLGLTEYRSLIPEICETYHEHQRRGPEHNEEASLDNPHPMNSDIMKDAALKRAAQNSFGECDQRNEGRVMCIFDAQVWWL